MADEVERLREERGDEKVSFGDVADHLHDYTDRHPDDAGVIQRLAGFLADVERRDHNHDAHPTRGLA